MLDKFQIKDDTAYYHPAGEVLFEEVIRLVPPFLAACRDARVKSAVFNANRLTGFPVPNTLNRYDFAVEIATHARGIPVAVVTHEHMIDPGRFGVIVATNRGARANVFATEADAETWLRSEANHIRLTGVDHVRNATQYAANTAQARRVIANANVLVIEDNEAYGRVLNDLLSANGYGVRSVTNRGDALLALQRHHYHSVLLDYNMPGIPIREFLPFCDGCKVILLSGIHDLEEEAEQLGVKWLPKPFLAEDLFSMLERA